LSPEALAFFFIVGGLAAKNKRSLLFIFVFIVGFVLFLSILGSAHNRRLWHRRCHKQKPTVIVVGAAD
jgi:uncharacterized membrane protein